MLRIILISFTSIKRDDLTFRIFFTKALQHRFAAETNLTVVNVDIIINRLVPNAFYGVISCESANRRVLLSQ